MYANLKLSSEKPRPDRPQTRVCVMTEDGIYITDHWDCNTNTTFSYSYSTNSVVLVEIY